MCSGEEPDLRWAVMPSYNARVTPRTRRTVAVACIAIVVAAAFVPAIAADLGSTILVPLGVVIPIVLVTIVRREAFRCDEQSVPLLSLVALRAPPAAA
jgi:hypothetical protein